MLLYASVDGFRESVGRLAVCPRCGVMSLVCREHRRDPWDGSTDVPSRARSWQLPGGYLLG